ncbi:MAG TPA: hypothetical protein PKA63_12180 [Oligoflexia bacterium]|nr:hypothetical protein [Oligoflexia bacterium]HMP49413.1 hypothetical protein [Oligoflexia bacterium]
MKPCHLFLFSIIFFSHNVMAQGKSIKSNKLILRYTGNSIEPSRLEINKLDSSVFFLNDSPNKDVQIEINFSGKKIHCHSDNLKLTNETLKSEKPVKPRDFEILCFPSSGTYAFQIKEEIPKGRILTGEIVVHE